MDEEIENILDKLEESECKIVKVYIEDKEKDIERLQNNLNSIAMILNIIVSNLQSIQTSIDTMVRELDRIGVLRRRSV